MIVNSPKCYKGIIIEESLEDTGILKTFCVSNVQITDEEDVSERWHICSVDGASEEQIQELAWYLKQGKWYVHFWRERSIIAVFRDKIFQFDADQRDSWLPVLEYGRSLGIPEEQLDFPIQ